MVSRGMTEQEAAHYLGLSHHTLRQARCDGPRKGRLHPPYCKVGRKVIYLRDDLDRWVEGCRVAGQEQQ